MEHFIKVIKSIIAEEIEKRPCIIEWMSDIKGNNVDYKGNIAYLVGNGLTRTAYDCWKRGFIGKNTNHAEKSNGISWDCLVDDFLSGVNFKADYEYLSYLGYTNSEIVQMAIEHAKEEEPFQSLFLFCKKLDEIPFLPIHVELLKRSDCILTTNYDRLFSKAAASNKIEFETTDNILYINDINKVSAKPAIIHLHGAYHQKGKDIYLNGEDIKKNIILDRSQYENAPSDKIRQISDMLCNRLIVGIGFGFAVDELIIAKLLEKREAPTVFIEIADELDPLAKYKIRGDRERTVVIKLPRGLCSSPLRRAIVPVVLVEMDMNAVRCDTSQKIFESLINDWKENKKLQSYKSTSSQVTVFGQASWNTVVGINEWIEPEQFLNPILGRMSPDLNDNCSQKVCFEIGGQGIMPVITLDALGIGCSSISAIATNNTGRKIYERLCYTDWVNFVDVMQVVKFNKPFNLTTTALIWKDVRSGVNTLDLKTQQELLKNALEASKLAGLIKGDNKDKVDIAEVSNCKILYLPGFSAEPFYNFCEPHENSNFFQNVLLLLDTGTAGRCIKAQNFVCSKGGIVIASPLAVLRHNQQYCLGDLLEGKIEKPSNGEVDINQLDEHGELWYSDQYMRINPKDERSRFRLILLLLNLIKLTKKLVFDDFLNHKGTYVVTLGGLGSIGACKKHDGQNCLLWVLDDNALKRMKNFNNKQKWENQYDDEAKNINNTLSCGDVYRSAFCASLIYAANNGKNCDSSFLNNLSTDHIAYAMACGNWIAHIKARFFKSEDFWDLLKDNLGCIINEFQNNWNRQENTFSFQLDDNRYSYTFSCLDGESEKFGEYINLAINELNFLVNKA